MFGSDPTTLQKLPTSEYRKRRAYWLIYRKAMNEPTDGSTTVIHGVEVTETSTLESGAAIHE